MPNFKYEVEFPTFDRVPEGFIPDLPRETFRLDGKEVSEEEFRAALPDGLVRRRRRPPSPELRGGGD